MPPATVKFTALLREEYQNLFDTCQIRPGKAGEVEAIVKKSQRLLPLW